MVFRGNFGLDLINARKIREFIKEKGKEGKYTIFLTSHNMADIEQVWERVIIINRGKIAFDGNLGDVYHIKGFQKQIKIVFDGPWSKDQLDHLGQIVKVNGQEAMLAVDAAEAASVASHLFSHFSIQDISITDMPLETIIESIYLKSGPTGMEK